jgi:hypothetical protein
VDICVEGIVGGTPVNVCLECRDHARPADVTWVDEMKANMSGFPRMPSSSLLTQGLRTERKRWRGVSERGGAALWNRSHFLFHALLKATSALWTKYVTFSAQKVAVGVRPTPVLPAENVAVMPENLLYAANGTVRGPIGELVKVVLNAPNAMPSFYRRQGGARLVRVAVGAAPGPNGGSIFPAEA